MHLWKQWYLFFFQDSWTLSTVSFCCVGCFSNCKTASEKMRSSLHVLWPFSIMWLHLSTHQWYHGLHQIEASSQLRRQYLFFFHFLLLWCCQDFSLCFIWSVTSGERSVCLHEIDTHTIVQKAPLVAVEFKHFSFTSFPSFIKFSPTTKSAVNSI